MTGYSVTVQDAKFTPADRLAALEYQAERDLICGGCGRPRDETMPPASRDFNARAVRCTGCEALQTAARARAGVEDEDPNAGILWRLEPGAPDGDLD